VQASTATPQPAWTVWKTAALLTVLVVVSRWPFRSHALFSWDSANFAMALDRIDIAMHRPHPPGYLGYVFAARALRLIFREANTALVVWNLVATMLAGLVTAIFALEVADRERRSLTAVAATAIILSSPLVWFYGEVAEIYVSELLFAALVGLTAARAARGSTRAMYACVAALAFTAAFKVVTAFLVFPVVAFAWTRVSPQTRRRSFGLAALAAAAVIVLFMAVQPDLWRVASRLAGSSEWSIWSFNSDREDLFRLLNRNLRNVMTAAVIAVGLVNVAGLAWWAIRDRRLPAGLNRGIAWAWALPILLFTVVLVIAKPGYLLPFLPLAAVILGGFYARFTPNTAVALVAAQALVNVGHFLWMTPFFPSMTGGELRYQDKAFPQRMASDLQALTFPTRFTIRESDRRVQDLLSFAATCPERTRLIVVDTAPVDWRRVMFYLPEATAIHAGAVGVDFVGRHTDFAPIPPEGSDFTTTCSVIWLSPDTGPGGVAAPKDAPLTPIPRLGWSTAAGTLHVTPAAVVVAAP